MECGNEEKLNSDEDLKNFVDGLGFDFEARLNIDNGEVNREGDELAMEDLSSEEERDEEEFSFFTFGEELPSPVAAEEAFADGQIKAVFPLFNQELLFAAGDSDLDSFREKLGIRSPVKKVFVETVGEVDPANSSAGGDDISGPYCEWSGRKAVEAAASEQACKKSNSTGFSRIWRFKEFVARCNSDGKDAFVFLNNNNARPPHAALKKKAAPESSAEGTPRKEKTGGRSKPAPLSPHEVYLRSKAKEGQRRRRAPTYLPYRPELVGFFTTVNGGGLTRNVHPF